MVAVDVNVLVHAHRAEQAEHMACRRLWENLQHCEEVCGVPDLVLSSFLRIVTHPGIYRVPTPISEALKAVDVIRSAANFRPLNPGPRHWGIFTWLVELSQARGNLVTDAYLASIALEHGCEWISTDRDFARFPGLRWRNPLEGPNDPAVLP